MKRLRVVLNNQKLFPLSVALAAVWVLLAGGANALGTNNTVWTVNKASSNLICSAPSYTCNTISAAVAAASSGDIIVVGPGTYNESVTIEPPKDSLSIFGAQAGRDARQRRDDPARESIVDASGTGNPTFYIDVPYVVIDGFTIQGGSGEYPAGIYMDGEGLPPVGLPFFIGGELPVAGLQVVNNIIKDNGGGVVLSHCGGNVVEHNLIKDNNAEAEHGSGYGVVAGFSGAVSINDNEFRGNYAAAIIIVLAEFATVVNNTSNDDGSFAVFLETLGSLFKNNRGRNFGAKETLPVEVSDPPGIDADAAVDIGSENFALEISDNDLEEGEGTISNGIAFTAVFGTSGYSEGVVIKNNKVKGFKKNGIVAETDPKATTGMALKCSIVANEVKDNGQHGIFIKGATSYNTNISLFENRAFGNGVYDCDDQSVASGPSGYTLGTHDTWYLNFGNSSKPAGICTQGNNSDHD